jgi:hypothetical protein
MPWHFFCTSFESHDNSYWFFTNSSCLSCSPFFIWKSLQWRIPYSFVSRVRQKIIREKSKIYKNSQNTIKIQNFVNFLKKVFSHENCARPKFFKNSYTRQKICVLWYGMINQIAKFQGLMHFRSIYVKRSENYSLSWFQIRKDFFLTMALLTTVDIQKQKENLH